MKNLIIAMVMDNFVKEPATEVNKILKKFLKDLFFVIISIYVTKCFKMMFFFVFVFTSLCPKLHLFGCIKSIKMNDFKSMSTHPLL